MRVFIARIEHRHGTDLSAHITEAGAYAFVADYVSENWGLEVSPKKEKMPEDPREAIARYFELMDGRMDAGSFEVAEMELAP